MKPVVKLIGLLLTIFALTAVTVVFAQDDVKIPEAVDTIATGDEITGELDEDNPIVAYSFEGAAGDIVSISLEFEDTDGYLLLADANGDVVASNDDAASIYSSRIPAFVLPEDGTYLIGVSTYSYVRGDIPEETAEFTLSLTAPEVVILEIGGEVEDETSEDAPQAYYFVELEAGQLIVASLQSDDFDTVLTIDPAAGQDTFQMYNDDFGDGTNSQVGPELITESGLYTITVAGYFDDTGSYSLQIAEVEPIPLTAGEAARGEITQDATEHYYSFEAEEGQTLTIAAEALGSTDLMLTLFSADGEWLDYNDDSDELNPAIEYDVTESGAHLILVSALGFFFDDSDLGEFDISVTVGSGK